LLKSYLVDYLLAERRAAIIKLLSLLKGNNTSLTFISSITSITCYQLERVLYVGHHQCTVYARTCAHLCSRQLCVCIHVSVVRSQALHTQQLHAGQGMFDCKRVHGYSVTQQYYRSSMITAQRHHSHNWLIYRAAHWCNVWVCTGTRGFT
jgi:hypothetical protein